MTFFCDGTGRDGWTDGRTDKQTDGQTDIGTDRLFSENIILDDEMHLSSKCIEAYQKLCYRDCYLFLVRLAFS